MNNQNDEYNPKKQLEKVTATLEQPDKFAIVFCKALESQKSIDTALKKVVKTLIKEDIETITSLKKYQREVDREDWKNFLKKMGVLGWSIIMLALGAILQTLSHKFL